MADNSGYGARLRSARQQIGMSLDEAGRRLRIEPKVLDAIESEDFANMPPKYMTRSMVNAYAQLLGLNATTMTREFLDAEFKYQLSRTNGVFDNSQSQNQISTRQASPAAVAQAAAAYGTGTSTARPQIAGGDLPSTTSSVSYRKSSTSSRSSSVDSAWQPGGYTRVGSELASDSGRQRVSLNDADDTRRSSVRRNADGSVRRPHFTALEDPDVDYADAPAIAINAQPKKDYSRLFMIVGSVLAVVLIVVLIKVIFVPESSGGIDPGETVSGLTDPEQTGISTSTSTTTRTPIKPTACYVSIQIGEQDVNLDLAETTGSFFDSNGDLYLTRDMFFYSGTVSAGSRYQYDITDKLYIRTSFPQYVTVTVNGERVDFQKIGWRYVVIVDFPAYLEQWEKDNATTES